MNFQVRSGCAGQCRVGLRQDRPSLQYIAVSWAACDLQHGFEVVAGPCCYFRALAALMLDDHQQFPEGGGHVDLKWLSLRRQDTQGRTGLSNQPQFVQLRSCRRAGRSIRMCLGETMWKVWALHQADACRSWTQPFARCARSPLVNDITEDHLSLIYQSLATAVP